LAKEVVLTATPVSQVSGGRTTPGRTLMPQVVRTAHVIPTSLLLVPTTTRDLIRLAAPAMTTLPAHAPVTSSGGSHALPKHSGTDARRASSAALNPAAVGVNDPTVRNLVHLWQPELMYCYTQFGVREHPTLSGGLVVRIALSPNGGVGHTVISGRTWNGGSGTEVEACIRSRIASWRFPPAAAGSMHEFPLDFAPDKQPSK
jgi:hypothetical protein